MQHENLCCLQNIPWTSRATITIEAARLLTHGMYQCMHSYNPENNLTININ